MTYKFKDETRIDSIIEFELIDNRLSILSVDEHKRESVTVSIDKKNVYRLIGALHFLHKEME
jgi:hypothetical protein